MKLPLEPVLGNGSNGQGAVPSWEPRTSFM